MFAAHAILERTNSDRRTTLGFGNSLDREAEWRVNWNRRGARLRVFLPAESNIFGVGRLPTALLAADLLLASIHEADTQREEEQIR
jgi:hypothetical protein